MKFLFINCVLEELSIFSDVKDRMDEEVIEKLKTNLGDTFQKVDQIENIEEIKELIEKIKKYELFFPKSLIQQLWTKWLFDRMTTASEIGQLDNDSTIPNNNSKSDGSFTNLIVEDRGNEEEIEEMKSNLRDIFQNVNQFVNFEEMKELMEEIKQYEKNLPKSLIQQLWAKWFFEQLIWWYVPGVKEEMGDVLWDHLGSPSGV